MAKGIEYPGSRDTVNAGGFEEVGAGQKEKLSTKAANTGAMD